MSEASSRSAPPEDWRRSSFVQEAATRIGRLVHEKVSVDALWRLVGAAAGEMQMNPEDARRSLQAGEQPATENLIAGIARYVTGGDAAPEPAVAAALGPVFGNRDMVLAQWEAGRKLIKVARQKSGQLLQYWVDGRCAAGFALPPVAPEVRNLVLAKLEAARKENDVLGWFHWLKDKMGRESGQG